MAFSKQTIPFTKCRYVCPFPLYFEYSWNCLPCFIHFGSSKIACFGFVCFFLDIFGFFFASFNPCWAIASAETRKGRRVTWRVGGSQLMLAKGSGNTSNSWLCLQGTGRGSQQHLGQSPGYGWRQDCPLISQQSYWRSSSEERVEATGDGCVQLYST